jgi:hypothetical protein
MSGSVTRSTTPSVIVADRADSAAVATAKGRSLLDGVVERSLTTYPLVMHDRHVLNDHPFAPEAAIPLIVLKDESLPARWRDLDNVRKNTATSEGRFTH